MKKNVIYLLMLLIVPALVLSSCKKDDEEETPEEPNVQFETLMTYMGANGMDITDILGNSTDGTKWVKAGSKVVDSADYSVPNFYVIDLRKAEDFELGHIKDAHNTTLGNILDEAANATKSKILVVCYSGQTSARATAALRLSGYPETYSLKWGMAGWNDEFNASWVGGATDVTTTSWVDDDAEPALVEFDYPVIESGESDGQSILEAQIQTILALGSEDWLLANDDVLANPSSYFIINKWSTADWTDYGHLVDAYRYDTDNGFSLAGLKKLDPETPFVFYCYTGQTSSITAFWLQVLGYTNARSLKFGANAIIYSDLFDGATTAAKSWLGAGSGSGLNFGYYIGADYYPPDVK